MYVFCLGLLISGFRVVFCVFLVVYSVFGGDFGVYFGVGFEKLCVF